MRWNVRVLTMVTLCAAVAAVVVRRAVAGRVECGCDAAAELEPRRQCAARSGAVDRDRPNVEDDESFPSGHATIAAVAARLSAVNLDAVDLSPGARTSAAVDISVGLPAFGQWHVRAAEHRVLIGRSRTPIVRGFG